MPNQLNREGTFRVQITDYCLMAPFKSGAIPVSITAKILESWNPDLGDNGEWESWEECEEYEAAGMIWVVKKDGNLNENGVQSLMDFAGWDGDFDSISNRTWQPTPCQIVVNEEKDADRAQYNQFPIAFVNDHDAVPGGQREMAPEMVSQLKTQHGAALRALKGNATRNAKPPKGKPAAPPTSQPEDPANAALQEAANSSQKPPDGPSTDEIAF
jgi:hypothetical protein